MKIYIKISFFLVISLTPFLCFAMDQVIFESLMSEIKNNQFENAEKYLEDNKKISENDPEYYVVLLNYAVHKAYQPQLAIAQGNPKQGEYALKDKKGNVSGFIGVRNKFNEELIVDAINQTQQAISNFKSRLDIHFGVAVIAKQIKRWDIVANQLVDVLEISREINNKWEWGSINGMGDNPEEFMLENVQGYASQLFSVNSDNANKALRKISLALIKYYPMNIFGYANMGSLHAANEQYKEAEEYYTKALEIAPNDEMVRANVSRMHFYSYMFTAVPIAIGVVLIATILIVVIRRRNKTNNIIDASN